MIVYLRVQALSLLLNGLLIGILTLTAFVIGAKYYNGDTSLFPLFPKNIIS